MLVLLTLLSVAVSPLQAAEAVQLEPNAVLKFEFPDLPETYFAHFHKADKQPAMLTAQLPENYSPNGKFPMLVFLSGGSGGRGDGAAFGRRIVGSRDYITVNMPLFKDTAHPALPILPPSLQNIPAQAGKLGFAINFNDFKVISPSYRGMLQKLLDTVPNITPKGSTIGGFSNGAHTTSVLLAGKDEFILSHFTQFVLLEGGIALMTNPAILQDPAIKDCRFLSLSGDQPDEPGRKIVQPLVDAMVQQLKAQKIDATSVIMAGYGHAAPPEYLKLIGNWIRGEPLPTIAPKAPSPTKVPGQKIDQAQGLDVR